MNPFDTENKRFIHTPIDDFYGIKFLDKPIHNVTVDLDASNQQILNDFKNWLTEIRKKNPGQLPRKQRIEKVNFDKKDFENWTKARILYAFDVRFVAEYNKIKLKEAEIAEIVFFDEDETVSNDKIDQFSKTKKTSNWLFTIPTVRAMATQIYSEKQTGTTPRSKKKTNCFINFSIWIRKRKFFRISS